MTIIAGPSGRQVALVQGERSHMDRRWWVVVDMKTREVLSGGFLLESDAAEEARRLLAVGEDPTPDNTTERT